MAIIAFDPQPGMGILGGEQLVLQTQTMLKDLAGHRKGSARPSDVQTGEMWLDDSAAPWVLKLWDGTSDVPVMSVDPSVHALALAGLTVGTDVQAYSDILAALAGLSPSASKLPYFTGAAAMSLTTLTSFARSLLAGADAAAMCSILGLGSLALQDTTYLNALATLALSANRLVYMDSSGVPTLLALGAAGTALKSQGPTSPPVFGNVSGMYELVSGPTSWTGTVLAFTGLESGYEYVIRLMDAVGAHCSNAVVGYGAGPTYYTSAGYANDYEVVYNGIEGDHVVESNILGYWNESGSTNTDGFFEFRILNTNNRYFKLLNDYLIMAGGVKKRLRIASTGDLGSGNKTTALRVTFTGSNALRYTVHRRPV